MAQAADSQPQHESRTNLMPWPASVKTTAGNLLPIAPAFTVVLRGNDQRLKKVAEMFLENLRCQTGMLPLDFTILNSGDNHPEAQGRMILTPQRSFQQIHPGTRRR